MSTTIRIRRTTHVVSITLLLLAVTFFGTPAFSQVTAGSLRIQVTDPNGTVIAGVSVTITRKDNGQSFTDTTSDQGVVIFNNLAPGFYDLVVEKSAFAKSVMSDVRVGIGEANEVKFQIGAATAEVRVSIESERQELVSALPNLNNDLSPLLQIVPGAIPGGPSTLGKVVIDGKGKDQQIIRLDGLDITQLVTVPSGDPSIDVLSSFQKPEVSYDIDNSSPKSRAAFESIFGPGSGIVIPAISYKADGTWRGQVYAAGQNDVFNARNYFDFDGKPGLRRTRFGGKLGGPLIKNRTGLYFGFDGVRGRSESSIYEAVPVTASCGCASGPLSSLMRGFLPAGTTVIPTASQDANFQVAKRRVRNQVESNAWNVRLDNSFSTNNSLVVWFTRQRADNVVPDGVTGRLQRQRVAFQNGLVEFKSVSGKTIHDIRVGLNENDGNVAVTVPTSTDGELSRSAIVPSGSVPVTGLPINGTTVSKATLGAQVKNTGRGFNLRPISVNASYDFDHPINSIKGREVLFGLELRRIGMSYDRLGGLTYTFSTLAALQSGVADTVSLLSDLSNRAPFSSGAGPRHADQTYLLGYFQMNWKLGRVSTRYGLRYDYFGAVHERDNRAVVVDPQAGTVLNSGTAFYQASKNNFQPRLSFDYPLADSGAFKDVVWSGGAGLYSGLPRVDDMLLAIDSDRFSTGAASAIYPVNSADLMKTFLDNPNTRQFQPVAFARTFSTPERVYKWETSLAKTIKEIYKLKLLYTGNAGRNLAVAGVANQIVSVATNPDPTKPAIVVRQFDLVNGGLVSKPYGEFYYRDSKGKSSYNGFTVQFARNSTPSTQTLPRWLDLSYLNIQYTLSRNVGNASGAVTSNPRNFGADYGYNAADARQSFTLSAVYDLWNALSRPKADLWTGWEFATQIGARSGLPLLVRLDRPDVVYVDAIGTVFSSPGAGRRAIINTPGGGASAATRVPNLIAGVDPYLHKRLELLNPAAFAIPAPGTFGNLTRGQLRGPASLQVDVSVVRYLFRKEHGSGEFKMGVSNLFNRANFNNPTVTLSNALGASAADNQIQPGVPFTAAAAGQLGVISAADPGRQFKFSLILKLNPLK